ncbi:MAG: DUF3990 domain-containing protein [bacterium]|nr:DUF3990 domain-containing protein [bacterium]
MKLYHSSTICVEKPDLVHSRQFLDFGKGFYLTSIYDQAVRYAERFARRGKEAWLNTYDLNFTPEDWKILNFYSYDKNWLDFVSKCRAGQDQSDYDIVIGGIANDRVIVTLDRYFVGEISQEQAIGLLRFEKPNIQYCIRSEKMLNECLTFIESKKL